MNYISNLLYGHEEGEMRVPLSSYTLEELKEQEREILLKIEELRKNGPSGKRKYARKQRGWFSENHYYLDKLKEIRDAIIEIRASQ